MKTSSKQNLWLVCLSFVAANVDAQVFSHRDQGEHFEAMVTNERIVVKQRYEGASTIHGDLSCPLGPAVRAHTLLTADSKVCFTFATNRCEYTRYQNGKAIHAQELANTGVPKMCIVLASAQDAQRLTVLVNAGRQQVQQPTAVPAAQAARPSVAPASAPPSELIKLVPASSGIVAQQAQAPSGKPHSRAAIQDDRTAAPFSSRAAPPTPLSERTQNAKQRVQTPAAPKQATTSAHAKATGEQTFGGIPVALFIHVRNAAQRVQAERLIEPLAARGVRVTGIKLMDQGPATSDLRYFYSEDARNTAQLLRVLRDLGVAAMQAKHIGGFETRATPRQYELWLAPVTTRQPSREILRSRQKQTTLARG